MTTEADPLGIVSGAPLGFTDALTYPYFQSVFDRKSRRVALGMTVESDVIEYSSPYEPVPLSELEEALLVMAATGLNGLALADLDLAIARGDVLGQHGPRAAVAVGLVLLHARGA